MIVLRELRKEIFNEDLTSQADGATGTFTTDFDFKTNTLRVYVNGQRLIKDTDYTVVASDQFSLVHYIPRNWFDIVVDYRRDF
ncbi:MAG: hypothetical protein KAS36_11220 [Anaerolineales bacterium]|nr:hypothetical protein [Anaerolineales bacterium]